MNFEYYYFTHSLQELASTFSILRVFTGNHCLEEMHSGSPLVVAKLQQLDACTNYSEKDYNTCCFPSNADGVENPSNAKVDNETMKISRARFGIARWRRWTARRTSGGPLFIFTAVNASFYVLIARKNWI